MSGISAIQLTSKLRNIVPPGPDIGGQGSGSRVEELDDAAQSGQRLGLDIARELLARVSLAAAPRVETPRGEPPADIAAARHRREIVELTEHAGAGEPLQDAKREAGAAHATARQAERRVRGPAVALEHLGRRQRFVRRCRRSVQVGVLPFEGAVDGERRRRGLVHDSTAERVVRAAMRSRVEYPSVNQPYTGRNAARVIPATGANRPPRKARCRPQFEGFRLLLARTLNRQPEALFSGRQVSAREEEFATRPVQLGRVPAFERGLCVHEALVNGQEPFVDAAGDGKHLGEQREKCRPNEAGADRLLHRQAVLQLIDAFGGAAERRQRRPLERAPPLGFLLQLVHRATARRSRRPC